MNKEEIMSLFEFYNDGSVKYLKKIYYEDIETVVDKIIILYKLKNAELEAKVYTYEKIIANSNFKPILKEKKGDNK